MKKKSGFRRSWLEELIKQKYGNPNAFAVHHLSISQQSLSNIISGKTARPKDPVLNELAATLGMDKEWILTGKSLGLTPLQKDLLSILHDYEVDEPAVLLFVLRNWARLTSRIEKEFLMKRWVDVVDALRQPNGSHK